MSVKYYNYPADKDDYNDIMRRIKILEEQILTLYGGNNG